VEWSVSDRDIILNFKAIKKLSKIYEKRGVSVFWVLAYLMGLNNLHTEIVPSNVRDMLDLNRNFPHHQFKCSSLTLKYRDWIRQCCENIPTLHLQLEDHRQKFLVVFKCKYMIKIKLFKTKKTYEYWYNHPGLYLWHGRRL
jgi:hypothetical protein